MQSAAGRKHNNLNSIKTCVASYLLKAFKTVFAWHVDIQENDLRLIRMSFLKRIQKLLSVVAYLHADFRIKFAERFHKYDTVILTGLTVSAKQKLVFTSQRDAPVNCHYILDQYFKLFVSTGFDRIKIGS